MTAETRKAFSGKVDFVIRDHNRSSGSLLFVEIRLKKIYDDHNHGKAFTQKEDLSECQIHTGEKLLKDNIYI